MSGEIAMNNEPGKTRRSIRLQGYDYSQTGAYFVTVSTHGKKCLFGEIVDGQIMLNDAGRVAKQCWNDIPVHFPHVELDEWVIMPNHVHGILHIVYATVGAKNFSPLPITKRPRGTSKTLGSVIRGFKIGVTKWVRQNNVIHNVWQRNYYEHIIRNDDEMNRIREYIVNNPLQWESDRENPSVRATGRMTHHQTTTHVSGGRYNAC
jgi:REP element-mobilizing transposase RayT